MRSYIKIVIDGLALQIYVLKALKKVFRIWQYALTISEYEWGTLFKCGTKIAIQQFPMQRIMCGVKWKESFEV